MPANLTKAEPGAWSGGCTEAAPPPLSTEEKVTRGVPFLGETLGVCTTSSAERESLGYPFALALLSGRCYLQKVGLQ